MYQLKGSRTDGIIPPSSAFLLFSGHQLIGCGPPT